jgi:hypothetical protein
MAIDETLGNRRAQKRAWIIGRNGGVPGVA